MRVNEIFYSLQGEGAFTGTPAVFLRLSGCNLRCWFCDTDFLSFREMTVEEIVSEVSKFPARNIVITGGEPTLQLTSSLTDSLHAAGFFIMMETNGTTPLPDGCSVDWITCSPKRRNRDSAELVTVRLEHIDELKVVYEGNAQDMSQYENIQAKQYRLQPCFTGDPERDLLTQQQTVQYVLDHPQWKLSLQTHKLLNIR